MSSTDQPAQSPPEGGETEDLVNKDVGVQADEGKQTSNSDDHFYREFWNSEQGRQLLRDYRSALFKNLGTNDS